jgi:hypothetical protein
MIFAISEDLVKMDRDIQIKRIYASAVPGDGTRVARLVAVTA